MNKNNEANQISFAQCILSFAEKHLFEKLTNDVNCIFMFCSMSNMQINNKHTMARQICILFHPETKTKNCSLEWLAQPQVERSICSLSHFESTPMPCLKYIPASAILYSISRPKFVYLYIAIFIQKIINNRFQRVPFHIIHFYCDSAWLDRFRRFGYFGF